MPSTIEMRPIGVARTPFTERASAPRQPRAAEGTPGTIELAPGMGLEDAVRDLEGWDRIWVLFWFHLNEGWRPTVQPPRSAVKRGVLATRSPHRPNPIGLSVLRLERVDGLVLHVRDVDLVDGTPVLDIKPYVAYTDAIPDAAEGWLEARPEDPAAPWDVVFAPEAETHLAFLEEHGVELRAPFTRALALGPQPHAYRRIKPDGDAMRIAVKAFRARFRADPLARAITVLAVTSGYATRVLRGPDRDPDLEVHRALLERFG